MKAEIIKTYNNLLSQFRDTLKETSVGTSKTDNFAYMTLSTEPVVNLDKFKDRVAKTMMLSEFPLSCDALFLANHNTMFMIEFKNGKIEGKRNYEIKVKVFESLLMLSEKFSQTIEFMRNNLTFVLVYNESVKHGQEQFDDARDVKDTSLEKIESALFALAKTRIIRFGLHRFRKLYFKEIYTYSKAEFETEFVDKYCL